MSIVRSHPLVSRDMHADIFTYKYKFSEVPFVTSWSLKAGFPGLVRNNLTEYLSLFPRFLVVVYNHKGIEMAKWTVLNYLQRFDVAVNPSSLDRSDKNNMTCVIPRRFNFEKIPKMQDFKNLDLGRKIRGNF